MKWVAALLICVPLAAFAQGPQPLPEDPVANRRAVELAEQLRCLVCQNQSIEESGADLAVDLRRQIREQIREGRSDAEIVSFMVQRYGDFVLYRPPLKLITILLWFGPPLLVLLGLAWLMGYVRARRRRIEAQPFSAEDRRAAELLLIGDDEGKRK